MSEMLKPGEWIYRRFPANRCTVCDAPATIVLHVGTGGNYQRRYACDEHVPPLGRREESHAD